MAFQYLKGTYKQEGERLFMSVDGDKTRVNGFKLRQGRLRLDMRRKFFTQRVVMHWNRLPKEVVDAPSLEAFKGHAACGSGQPGLEVGDPAHSRGLERDDHCGPFQPRPFYDSTTFTAPARSTQPACAQDGSSCAMAQTSLLGHPKEPLSRCSVVFLGISALGWGQTHGVCPSWAHPVRS